IALVDKMMVHVKQLLRVLLTEDTVDDFFREIGI
ncbi:MAG: hypothetical protein JWR43_841, partial [Phenylobacterium sp.]|nr:hypothetical protein [Phenylobacterium sp.]